MQALVSPVRLILSEMWDVADPVRFLGPKEISVESRMVSSCYGVDELSLRVPCCHIVGRLCPGNSASLPNCPVMNAQMRTNHLPCVQIYKVPRSVLNVL
jgi:hypothetical protein